MSTSINLPQEIEKKVSRLAAETGQSQIFYLHAIMKYLDDLRDMRQSGQGKKGAGDEIHKAGRKPGATPLTRFAGAWCGEALIREDQGKYETRRGLK